MAAVAQLALLAVVFSTIFATSLSSGTCPIKDDVPAEDISAPLEATARAMLGSSSDPQIHWALGELLLMGDPTTLDPLSAMDRLSEAEGHFGIDGGGEKGGEIEGHFTLNYEIFPTTLIS